MVEDTTIIVFLENLSPNGGGNPQKNHEAILNSFGSFEDFKSNFTAAANKIRL